MDWLCSLGTMQINWLEKWLAFEYKGAHVFLQGYSHVSFNCKVAELHLVQPDSDKGVNVPLPAPIQEVLDQYACDHHIPLMEGAQPVNIWPC